MSIKSLLVATAVLAFSATPVLAAAIGTTI